MPVYGTCQQCGAAISAKFPSLLQRYCSHKCAGKAGHPAVDPAIRFAAFVPPDRGADDCWEWTGSRIRRGYGHFRVGTRKVKAHRFAWELAHGTPPPGNMLVCHTCDNPPCVNPAHLFLGTTADNVQDRVRKGRSASGDRSGTRTHPEAYRANQVRGERHPLSRLTADDVLSIRARWPNESMQRLADTFGVSIRAIHGVIHRKSWAHI